MCFSSGAGRALGQATRLHPRASLVLLGCALVCRGAQAQAWTEAISATPLDGSEREVLRAAHAQRGGLLWLQGNQPSAQALALVARVVRAGDDGLAPEDFDGAALGA